jgi:hypothetical protein
MQETFIYEQSIPFEALLERMKHLLIRFRAVKNGRIVF